MLLALRCSVMKRMNAIVPQPDHESQGADLSILSLWSRGCLINFDHSQTFFELEGKT